MNTLIAISGLGILSLIAEIFNGRKAIIPLTILGLIGIFSYNISPYNPYGIYFNNMMMVDKFSVSFTSLFIMITLFLILLGSEFYKDRPTNISDFISIKIFMLAGAVAMISFGNLSMFFIGIEILSISLYVLAASKPRDLRSNEAGMKYFLMGSFASGIILFGLTLIYGSTGSFDMMNIYQTIHSMNYPQWYFIGIVFLSIGMLFKIATAPFHFWAPDVYEGSPALTTATMSTLAKIVAMASFYKLFMILIPEQLYIVKSIYIVVAILSMIIGNLMALKQNNVKRMFAFSGISHAGFMLSTLLIMNNSANVLFYYATAYALSGIAFFAVLLFVANNPHHKHHETVDNFNGLAETHPLLALVMTGSLLSMAGIPIMGGFFAKFFLLNQLVQTGNILLVIFAVIASIISIGYYFRIILAMYTKPSDKTLGKTPLIYQLVAVFGLIAIIVMGIMPSMIYELLG